MKKAFFASILFLMSASVQAGLESLKSATLKDQKRSQEQDLRTPAPAPVARASDRNRIVVTHLTRPMDSRIVPPANLSNKKKPINLKAIATPETLVPNPFDVSLLNDISFNDFSISQNGTDLYTGNGRKGGSDYAMYDSAGSITSFDANNQINLKFINTFDNTKIINPVVTPVSDISATNPVKDANRSVYPISAAENPDTSGPMIDMSNPDIQNGAGTAPKSGLHFDFSSISTLINGNSVKGVRMVDFTLCINLANFASATDLQHIYAYWGQYGLGGSGVLPMTSADIAGADVNYASIFTLDPEDFGITFDSTGAPILPSSPFFNSMGAYSTSPTQSGVVDRCVIRLALALPADTMEWLFIAPGVA